MLGYLAVIIALLQIKDSLRNIIINVFDLQFSLYVALLVFIFFLILIMYLFALTYFKFWEEKTRPVLKTIKQTAEILFNFSLVSPILFGLLIVSSYIIKTLHNFSPTTAFAVNQGFSFITTMVIAVFSINTFYSLKKAGASSKNISNEEKEEIRKRFAKQQSSVINRTAVLLGAITSVLTIIVEIFAK